MISAIGFLVAVGAVSAVCFVLITRAENARLNRARGGSAYDGGISSDSDGWSLANWVAYSSSVTSSASSEASSNAADSGACTSGSWDSGSFDSGGGDCGGGASGGSD